MTAGNNNRAISVRETIQTPLGEFTLIPTAMNTRPLRPCAQGFNAYRQYDENWRTDVRLLLYKAETGVILHAIYVSRRMEFPSLGFATPYTPAEILSNEPLLSTECKFRQFPDNPTHVTTCKCTDGRVVSTTFERGS